jgi:hypothetical protein
MTLVGKPQWNNAILAYLVPPREDLPFQSPRILVFTRHPVTIIHKEGFSLPSKLTHDKEIMTRELSDPEHLPCFLVQIDEDNQYMYFVMDDTPPEVHRILNCRLDDVEDKTTVPGYNSANPPSPIILPGAAPVAPGAGGNLIIPGQTPTGSGGYSGDTILRVEMDWQITEEADMNLITKVRGIVLGANLI